MMSFKGALLCVKLSFRCYPHPQWRHLNMLILPWKVLYGVFSTFLTSLAFGKVLDVCYETVFTAKVKAGADEHI